MTLQASRFMASIVRAERAQEHRMLGRATQTWDHLPLSDFTPELEARKTDATRAALHSGKTLRQEQRAVLKGLGYDPRF